jgi:hypothetical protein
MCIFAVVVIDFDTLKVNYYAQTWLTDWGKVALKIRVHTCYTKQWSAHNEDHSLKMSLFPVAIEPSSSVCPSSRKSGCALLASHTHLALLVEGRRGYDGVKMDLPSPPRPCKLELQPWWCRGDSYLEQFASIPAVSLRRALSLSTSLSCAHTHCGKPRRKLPRPLPDMTS